MDEQEIVNVAMENFNKENTITTAELTNDDNNSSEENAVVMDSSNIKKVTTSELSCTVDNISRENAASMSNDLHEENEVYSQQVTEGKPIIGKQKKLNRLKIIDSDSENDAVEKYTGSVENVVIKKSTRLQLFDSDSEEDIDRDNMKEQIHQNMEVCDLENPSEKMDFDSQPSEIVRTLPNKMTTTDSDDDITHTQLQNVTSGTNINDIVKETVQQASFDEEVENQIADKIKSSGIESKLNERSINIQDIGNETVLQASKLAALCDPESSDEEVEDEIAEDKIKSNKSMGNLNESKIEDKNNTIRKLTPQEALEQRKEIQSESQRMLRESNISLPYHKPKQRTLREFLQKRPKFSETVPIPDQRTPPSVSIKMSSKHLDIISKKMEEREKEVEKFFQSDSEDSGAEDNNINDNGIKSINFTKCDEIANEEPHSSGESTVVIESAEILTSQETDTTQDIAGSSNDENVQIHDLNEARNENSTEEGNDSVQNISKDANQQGALSKRQLLLERIGNLKPKLSGGPNFVIDLEENTTKPDQINDLVQRFMHHNSRKKPHKNKVQLSIVTVTGCGEIQKENMSLKVEEDPMDMTTMNTPGEKMQKLRLELQHQIAERRSKMWSEKQTHECNEDEEEDEYLSIYKGEKDSSCNHEVDDAFDGDDETENENPQAKHDLIDDEAGEENEEYEEREGEEDDYENEESESESNDSTEDIEQIPNSAKKQLKRIIMNEDSDEEECNKNGSTDSWEDQPQPGQQSNQLTPKRSLGDSKLEFGFLTPVCHLTGLQSLNSGSKFLHDSPVSPNIQLPPEPSPLKGYQKKLFSDTDLASTQNYSDDECEHEKSLKTALINGKEHFMEQKLTPSTQDLLNLCSGKFTGFTQEDSVSSAIRENGNLSDANRFNGNMNSLNTVLNENPVDNIPAPEEEDDDKLISQILDDDEMEAFKKKFESPVIIPGEPNAVNSPSISAKISFESDEESDDDEGVIGVKRKTFNPLIDSDEEKDSDNNEEGEDVEAEEELEVEYDSEENEIEFEASDPKKRIKMADFFENEAELSESEWGSEDEDEKNLDQMEFELGDSEKIDEDKVKRDLEKIHRRQLFDDDKLEVKILQELLLEDGELHGTGREKQFRWKNIDSANENNEENVNQNENEDLLLEDDDNEEEWRKRRFEREIFLMKKKDVDASNTNYDDDYKLNSNSLKGPNLLLTNCMQAEKSIQAKRGSFLSRKDEVLSRVAEYSKENINKNGAATSKKHFIFQSVNVETAQTLEIKKRKAVDKGTPQAIKKIRIDTISPSLHKSNNAKLKKLFSNV